MKQKKAFRKAISLMLALVMITGIMAVPAAADKSAGSTEYGQYDSMLTIGTSMIRGYGVGPYDTYDLSTVHGFEGNAPYYVADALGVKSEDTYLAAFAGCTVTMPLWLLGLADPTEDFMYNYSADHRDVRYGQRIMNTFGADVGGTGYSFKKVLDSTDLIIMELGLGDTIFRAREVLFQMAREGDIDTVDIEVVKQFKEGFEYFKQRFPDLLDYIKENNPEAEVVIVGTANSLSGIRLTNLGIIPVGNELDIAYLTLNSYLKKTAQEYGYKYADISGTEMRAKKEHLPIVSLEFLQQMEYYMHPSDDGIQYITNQILKQLKADKKIDIDLSSAKSVSSVLVDAKDTKNFAFDAAAHTLTISVKDSSAKLMTVTYVGANGATYSATYKLSCGDNGYTAKRIMSAIVAGPITTNALTAAFSFFRNIGNLFKGLFK